MTTPANPVDIFELLDIETREDTYSRLIVHHLGHSIGLRQQLLTHAFGSSAPRAVQGDEIFLRHKLPDEAGIVDIFLQSPAGTPDRWAMFIESKLFSAEHGEQVKRYWNATRGLVGPTGRCAGVFLTIAGDGSSCEHVVPLTHRQLTAWIREHLADLPDDPVLRIAADGYIARAQAPLPEALDDARVSRLLEPSWGLVPRLAGVAAVGAALHRGLAGGWTHDAIWIQGRGHANPGLLFWQPGWWGTEVTGARWTPENYNVHLEIELTEHGPWKLKLHFEAEPYHTLAEIATLENHAAFTAMRDAFRAAIHARQAELPGWKMSNYPLQMAVFKVDLGPTSTVAVAREQLAPALAQIAPHIHAALSNARKAATPT